MQGLEIWKNPKNKFVVAQVHYTADDDKATQDWFKKTREGMPKTSWDKEYEIDFGALSGQRIWDVFDKQIHVIPYFEVPREWNRVRAIDFGQWNPCCGLWGAVDYDSNVYIYREYYRGGRVIAKVHAGEIARLSKYESSQDNYSKEDEIYIDSVIDPSTKAKNQTKDNQPYSVLEIFDDNNVWVTLADNDTRTGWDRVYEYFTPQPYYDANGLVLGSKPKLFIFSRCVNLITEIPNYRYKQLSPIQERTSDEKEEAVKKKDHACDTLRYLMMTRPRIPDRPQEKLTRIQRDIRSSVKGRDNENKQGLQDQFNQT